MNCGNCGAQVSANDMFCPSCGSQMNQQTSSLNNSFCAGCGTELLPSDIFCPNCGRAINSYYAEEPPVYNKKTPKKSKTGLVILITVIVVTIAASAAALTYFFLNRENDSERNSTEETVETSRPKEEAPTSKPTPEPTPTPKPPKFDSVEVSSTRGYDVDELNGNTVVYYYPSYVMDGNMSTAWSPNRHIDSYEPYVTITANTEQYVKGIRMTNGYCKSERTYTKNKRITRARISYNGGSKEVDFGLDNYGKMIDIEFDEPVYTDYITVTVLSTKDGGWHDVAISEIEAY